MLSRLLPLLFAAALVGCVSAQQKRLNAVSARAATDLGCEEVGLQPLSEALIIASGCHRQAKYVVTCVMGGCHAVPTKDSDLVAPRDEVHLQEHDHSH